MPLRTREELTREFAVFQELFASDEKVFGGSGPDTVDLQLFGLVQKGASIPVPAVESARAIERASFGFGVAMD